MRMLFFFLNTLYLLWAKEYILNLVYWFILYKGNPILSGLALSLWRHSTKRLKSLVILQKMNLINLILHGTMHLDIYSDKHKHNACQHKVLDLSFLCNRRTHQMCRNLVVFVSYHYFLSQQTCF